MMEVNNVREIDLEAQNDIEEENHYDERFKIQNKVESYLKSLNLIVVSDVGRSILHERYIQIFAKIEKRQRELNFLYNTLRILLFVSGVIVPALIAVQENLSCDSDQRLIVWYVSLFFSFLGSLSNGAVETFSMPRLALESKYLSEKVEQEGWLFLSLSGHYAKYRLHERAWRRFVYNIEKIYNSRFESREGNSTMQRNRTETSQNAYDFNSAGSEPSSNNNDAILVRN